LSGASLASCSRNDEGDATGNDPFSARSVAPEDQFGKNFGKAYRADRNAEPRPVKEGDVVPVSRTTEPVEVR
jgi:hypothetical protein